MKRSLVIILFLISVQMVFAQLQRVTGRAEDKFHAPLYGASVILSSGPFSTTTVSDSSGFFVFNHVQPGRYALRVTFTGYQFWTQEILVNSSRAAEVVVMLEEIPSILEGVEISARTMNEQLGGQVVTIEKTMRVPANFFDPVRVVTSYPGVMTANDQNNTIVVRGNSPAGLLWRINGLDVVNPNHLANAGTFSDKPASYGGGVNIISSQLLERTDFYTGPIPARYGNMLSGVVDMNLRDGDHLESHYTVQASLIGLDAAAEGPLGKNKTTSYLINYRYSTVGLLSAMGAKFGDEDIRFQDLSFNINSRPSASSKLSLFGFYGNSMNSFEHKDADEWEVDKDRYDIDYTSKNFGAGLSYHQSIREFSIYSGVSVSGSDQKRDQFASPEIAANTLGVVHADRFDADKLLVSAFARVQASVNSTLLESGVTVNYLSDDLLQYNQSDNQQSSILRGKVDGVLVQPYAQWRIFLSEKWIAQTAMRYVYYTYNKTGALEPRIAIEYFPSAQSSFKFSYNLLSQLQQAGTYLNNNKYLELSKSHHLDAGYTMSTDNGFKFSATAYYQRMFDVPVQIVSSSYSVLNAIELTALPDLISEGAGSNYGFELLTEKSFYDKSYFIAGGSFYKSSYEGSDGVERTTRFDGNYSVNITYGREWSKMKKESFRTFGVSSRLLYLGGLKESPIVPNDAVAATQYNEAKAFENKLKDYFRLDLRINWRKNKPNYTRTIAIDIQNVFNVQNEAYHYYDHVKGKVTTQYQLGLIPVLVYRVDF